jgi:hypothetical protein
MRRMTRRRIIAAGPILAGLLAAAAFGRRGQAANRKPVGTVARLVGTVGVVAGATTRPLAPGATLFAGDQVVTGADGRLEIACIDGSTIVVGAATTVAIADFSTGADGSGKTGLIDLAVGLLRVSVPRAWQRFEVATPTAIASVRSTEWVVEVAAGNSAVFVVHGRVEVVDRQLRGGVILDPGDGTDVRAGAAPTVAHRWAKKRVDDVLSRTTVP